MKKNFNHDVFEPSWLECETNLQITIIPVTYLATIKNFFVLLCNLNLLSLRDFNFISHPMLLMLLALSSKQSSHLDSPEDYLTLTLLSLCLGLREILLPLFLKHHLITFVCIFQFCYSFSLLFRNTTHTHLYKFSSPMTFSCFIIYFESFFCCLHKTKVC